MKKSCKGCYAAVTGSHPLIGDSTGCNLGYKCQDGKPAEDCPKPKSWKQLRTIEKEKQG